MRTLKIISLTIAVMLLLSVMPISATTDVFSAEFSTILNDRNQIVLKRFRPTNENDVFYLVDALYNQITFNADSALWFDFYGDTHDYDNATIEVSMTKSDTPDQTESHTVELVFDYDPDIKTEVDLIVEKLPTGEVTEDGFLPYHYSVRDLELINYWVTYGDRDDYSVYLANYSEEFKRNIGYRNFVIDMRAGDGDFFYTFASGFANFTHNKTVYAHYNLEVQADNILYVPDDTAAGDIVAAAQKRIDDYVGMGKISLVYEGTVSEVIGCDSYFDGIANDDICVTAKINGKEYYIAIVKDSDKMSDPTYKNIDISSDIEITTGVSSVPLDTMLEVEKLSSGEEYESIVDILGVEENETFDIKLHSSNTGDYITELESGEFEVKIPICEDLTGKDLTVYYVDDNNNVTEYDTTENNGYACFTTNHFSIYTLAAAASCDHIYTDEYDYDCNKCGYLRAGDVSGDGTIDTNDLVSLKKVLLNLQVSDSSDVNRDGKTDIKDLIRLKKILAKKL